MDPSHPLPPVPTEQSLQPRLAPMALEQASQPRVQEQPSPSGSDHAGSVGHSTSAKKPLLGGSEGPGDSPPRGRVSPHPEFEPVTPQNPPHARSRDGHLLARAMSRRTGLGHTTSMSGIDYLVPVMEKPHLRTLGERLAPTIINAQREKEKYAVKAQWTSYALNIAIGLQVLLGALTTGISAALSGKQNIGIAISLLGGMATIVASYLARARGSNEPELSITRVKDLDQFLRDCAAFEMDHGHEYGTPENKLDFRLIELRRRFEELLGNSDGQRKLSPV